MVYLGRVIATGLTPDGYPFAAYAISGRSEGSQKRRFNSFTEEGRIYVGPIGELTQWQKDFAALIFYNCMRTRGDILFVTNGAQTDTNEVKGEKKPTFYHDFQNEKGHVSAREIMSHWGYEADQPIFTPRTALVKNPDDNALFSIVARFNDDNDRLFTAQMETRVNRGSARYLATYKGIGDEAASWRGIDLINDGNRYVFDAEIAGSTPEEIRDVMYKFVDERFVVASVAAVWNGREWVISEPKNRFNNEDEFKAHWGAKLKS